MIDGAGVFTIYRRVILPLCRPALAALATLLFVWIYNDFFWALMLFKSGDKRPITAALNNLSGHVLHRPDAGGGAVGDRGRADDRALPDSAAILHQRPDARFGQGLTRRPEPDSQTRRQPEIRWPSSGTRRPGSSTSGTTRSATSCACSRTAGSGRCISARPWPKAGRTATWCRASSSASRNRLGEPVPLEYPSGGTRRLSDPGPGDRAARRLRRAGPALHEPPHPARQARDCRGCPRRTSRSAARRRPSRSPRPTPSAQIEVRLLYTIYRDRPLVVRRARIVNAGTAAVVVRCAMSASLDLPDSDWELISLSGEWARECHVERHASSPGPAISVEPPRSVRPPAQPVRGP